MTEQMVQIKKGGNVRFNDWRIVGEMEPDPFV
jgi:hypothetical protein